MTDLPPLTLVLCATPRTGSTLLCALLASTGVAGRPESWFRAEDRAEYALDWSVPRDASGRIDSAAYLAAARRAGQTPNGICGLRLQAPTLPEFLAELAALDPRPARDSDRLRRAFGPCRYVWCRRRDDVAQAISRLKAEVSQVWHLDGTEPDRPVARARYDATRIDRFRAEAAAGNALWARWFPDQGIEPFVVDYEDFTEDPPAHVRRLLAWAGIVLPPGTPIAAPNRRMADSESTDWAARYRAERGLGGAPHAI